MSGVTIDDVPLWIVSAGISHAVAERQCGTCYTACGSLIWGDAQQERTKRVCRRCRERLKQATLVAARAAGGGE